MIHFLLRSVSGQTKTHQKVDSDELIQSKLNHLLGTASKKDQLSASSVSNAPITRVRKLSNAIAGAFSLASTNQQSGGDASQRPQSWVRIQIPQPPMPSLLTLLPAPVTFKILQHLSSKDLCRVSEVCKSWYPLATDDRLWIQLCMDRGWIDISSGRLQKAGVMSPHPSMENDGGNLHAISENYDANQDDEHSLRVNWKRVFALRSRTEKNWRILNHRVVEIGHQHKRILKLSSDSADRLTKADPEAPVGKEFKSEGNLSEKALPLPPSLLTSHSSTSIKKSMSLKNNSNSSLNRNSQIPSNAPRFSVSIEKQTGTQPALVEREIIDIIPAHRLAIYCIASDAEHIVTGSKDGRIRVWTANNGFPVKRNDSMAIEPDHPQYHLLWDLEAPLYQQLNFSMNPPSHSEDWLPTPVLSLDLMGTKIIAGLYDGSIVIWNIVSGTMLAHLKREHADGISALRIFRNKLSKESHPDAYQPKSAMIFATASFDGTVRVYEIAELRNTDSLLTDPHQSLPRDRKIKKRNEQKKKTSSCIVQNNIRISIKHVMRVANQNLFCLCFAGGPNFEDTTLATAGTDKFIHMWDSDGWTKELKRLTGHEDTILSLASLDDLLVSGSMDKTLKGSSCSARIYYFSSLK